MKTLNQKEFEQQNVFGLGAANDAYAQYFIGQSYLNPLTKPEDGLFLANVTFEPGCRNNWHIHHAVQGGGQLLIVIPAGVKHWHGARKDAWFSHIAIEMPGEGCSNEWLEPVGDEEYGKLS